MTDKTKQIQTLRFLRYYVYQNKKDSQRSSLLIEWAITGIDQPVQMWSELGRGHLNTLTGKPMKLGKSGHFRITRGSKLCRWLEENGINLKKLSEAHSGLKSRLTDESYEWSGKVYEVDQKSVRDDRKTEIQRKNRVDLFDVKRKKITPLITPEQSKSDTDEIPF